MSTIKITAAFYYMDDETHAVEIELPIANVSYWTTARKNKLDGNAWWNTCIVMHTKGCCYVRQTPDQVRALYEAALKRAPLQVPRLHDRFTR